jgi:hypothetical protein
LFCFCVYMFVLLPFSASACIVIGLSATEQIELS